MTNELNKSQEFIKKLQLERTDYKYPSQVRTISKSLLQLSQGIYTEPERFVYELLQNAVDAFSDTGQSSLEIHIKVENDRFIFMHNGNPFSEIDVEGISDVGNGTKANDSKKIGYKGIGFKSVFMPSVSRVGVISGDFCFEFNKERAFYLMPEFPDDKPLTTDDIPWQVIPIDSPGLREECDNPGFNVITIVYTSEAQAIATKINELFSELQFLLFLRNDNVTIRFERNNQEVFCIRKVRQQSELPSIHIASLFRNEKEESKWMLFTKEIPVPPKVKTALEHDFNTPNKLKEAQDVELSFAVQIDGNKVVPVSNASVFTFLPTSYKGLRQPFLINANFITDAGRQQLHQESEWNKFIFEKIPELYLEFVSAFSRKYSNYTEVLPNIYPDNDTLVGVYRKALQPAFHSVAFVPNRDGDLLKIDDILIDKTGISKSVIPIGLFLRHVNSIWYTRFTNKSFVDDTSIIGCVLGSIKVFEDKHLSDLISDEAVASSISEQEDVRLINFLYERACGLLNESKSTNDSFKESLQHTPFLLDADCELRLPNDLVFPSSYQECDVAASNVPIINKTVFSAIKCEKGLVEWLHSLGVEDLSDMTFVDYLFEHPDYITVENAISVGRSLFETWKKENFLERKPYSDRIKEISFLAKDGNIYPISNLYLGSFYDPEDDMESVLPQKPELFLSDDYPENGSVEDWSYFMKKCGIGYKLGITERVYPESELMCDLLKDAVKSFSDYPHDYAGYLGFPNPIIDIKVKLGYISFIDYQKPDYTLDQSVFSKVLSQDRRGWETKERIWGPIKYWSKYRGEPPVDKPLMDLLPHSISSRYGSFLEYVLANEQKFPTSQGDSKCANEVFINSPSIMGIGSKYLPVLALSTTVHESWREILPFKQELSINDLLFVLGKLSEDESIDQAEKEDRVSAIYRLILERGQQESDVISEWAKSNKLLSRSGLFLPAKELTYITVDGFKDDGSRVYCERLGQGNFDKKIKLLKSFGVKVITQEDIVPKFENAVENDELKDKLVRKLQYVTILKQSSKKDAEEQRNEIYDRIKTSKFFKCSSIYLTYGKDEDTISKNTFSEGKAFYYTGNITVAKMEPLLAPLCRFLNIVGCESELMVILLTDDHHSLVEYLADKGYDIKGIAEPQLTNLSKEGRSDSLRKLDTHSAKIEYAEEANSSETPMPIVDSPGTVLHKGKLTPEERIQLNREARIAAKKYLENEMGYNCSGWDAENSRQIVYDVKCKEESIVVVVISSNESRLHLHPYAFAELMGNPQNLLLNYVDGKIYSLSFNEIFLDNPNVNLIFDADIITSKEFAFIANRYRTSQRTCFVVENPKFSISDQIKGFGLDEKKEGGDVFVDISLDVLFDF